MPVFRNSNPSRQLGTLGRQTPLIYNGDGWSIPENTNYMPNDEPMGSSMLQYPVLFSPPPGSLSVPQFDRPYSSHWQQECKPCIPYDELLYHSSMGNPSCLPSPKENHTRRRGPGHIPRPRNAFMIFRSAYIANHKFLSGVRQNELSKQAGQAWNEMTECERDPYVQLACLEKQRHHAMYPNYIYCPSARRKSRASTKKAKNDSEVTPSSASLVSSESTTPGIPSTTPTLRPPHVAAQLAVQRFLQSHPDPEPPAKGDVVVPTGSRVSEPNSPVAEDGFVPMANIPELELTPSEKEGDFDLSTRPIHLDFIPEQFGFKCHNGSTAVLAHLPPTPNLDDAAPTEHAPPPPSQAPSQANIPTTSVLGNISELSMADNAPVSWQQPCSRTPSLANIPTTLIPYNTPIAFSTDGNAPDCYWQQPMNESFPQSVSDFTWSSDADIFHNDPIPSEAIMAWDDFSFMSYFFGF